MLSQLIDKTLLHFRNSEDVRPQIRKACKENSDIARYRVLGTSEADRPIDAAVIGSGTKRVSLIAGSHSDEPVGPETLRTFILNGLAARDQLKELFSKFTFLIVPHVNPDGEEQNQTWIQEWPSCESYLKHAFRELPGLDIEFGYPKMRRENVHVSDFLLDHGPIAMHMSLHSMSFSEGALLLIERHWTNRTRHLREQFQSMVGRFGLQLHDHDRCGEKGFAYIGPGFSTTPEGQAMRRHFESLGDLDTARLFHASSMEFVRKIGGDPLCLVTEFPLFVIGKRYESPAGTPQAYLDLKARIPELQNRLLRHEDIGDTIKEFQIEPLPLPSAIELQLRTIQLGLDTLVNSR